MIVAWEEEEDDDDDDDDVFYNRLRCLVLEYVNEGDTGKHGKPYLYEFRHHQMAPPASKFKKINSLIFFSFCAILTFCLRCFC